MRTISAVSLLAVGLSSVGFADLLVSRGTSGVDRYSNSGAFLGTFIAPGTGGLVDAQGVAVSPTTGELFVGDFTNSNILRFNADGTFSGVFAGGADVSTPFDVVFGTGGDIFVANAGGVDQISRFDTSGALITANFTSGNVTPIGGPQYLEFGPTLALTDIAGHLFRFNPVTGTHIPPTFFLDNPEGVAFNAAGDLFVAQRISNNVLRLPAGGGPIQEVIPNGAFAGAPADIEIGPDGLLYVSASTIYRFDVSGANGVLVDSFGTGGEFLVFTPIPEPGTWVLMGASLAFLAFLRRR